MVRSRRLAIWLGASAGLGAILAAWLIGAAMGRRPHALQTPPPPPLEVATVPHAARPGANDGTGGGRAALSSRSLPSRSPGDLLAEALAIRARDGTGSRVIGKLSGGRGEPGTGGPDEANARHVGEPGVDRHIDAVTRLLAGDYEAAIRALPAAATDPLRAPLVYNDLAVAHLTRAYVTGNRDDFSAALRWTRRALVLNSLCIEARVNQALARAGRRLALAEPAGGQATTRRP